MKRLKVSREGIVLIKSFEGFRPRAIRRDDGRWVIGYGHTLSAREGASVSEADAELLLQYDLLPVAQAVNETVGERVNQHQFDALASFAFSVGVDRFQSSDVLERIRAGFSTEAADAMVGWPETTAPEAALRRRAAERALFVADPASPVSLADLLAAPLPPPPVTAPVEETVADPAPVIEAAPVVAEDSAAEAVVAEDAALVPANDAPTLDARSAAVAHLLGASATLRGPAVEAEAEPEPAPQDTPSEAVATTAGSDDVSPETLTTEPAAEPLVAPEDEATNADADTAPSFAFSPEAETAPVAPQADPDANPSISFPPIAFQRYAPYGASIVGALPDIAASPAPESGPAPAPEPVEAEAAVEPDLQPATVIAFTGGRVPIENSTTADAAVEPAAAERTDPAPPVEPLVLTPSSDTAFASAGRLVWPEEQRGDDAKSQSPLFDEDAILHRTLGPVVRPDMIDPAADRFSWGEAGAYLLMGGFGLVSFGMSMAAVRLASQQSSGSGDTTMIAGVLFVIGVTCVGVSTYNLYRRWGRASED